MKKFMLSAIAIAALSLSAFAAESGLKKGEEVAPYHPSHVAGPFANTDKCFPCNFKQRPQVQAWFNGDDSANIGKIAADLDKAISKYAKTEFKAMIVILVDESELAAKKTKYADWAKGAKLKNVAVALLPKNHEAVKDYKFSLSGDVKNTVFVYKNWKVTDKMVNLVADKNGLTNLNKAIAMINK